MNLTRTNWPKGWLPSEDAVNGDPAGLLRMDNLTLDKEGVLSLIDGQKKMVTLNDSIGAFFSRVINGIEYFWIGTGSSCLRYDQGWGVGIDMQVPGAGAIGTESLSAFCDALGQVICLDGSMRTKDRALPNTAPLPLGLLTPIDQNTGNGPTGQVNPQQPLAVLPGNYQILAGLPAAGYSGFGVAPDPTLSAQVIISTPSFGPLDTTNISGQLFYGLPSLDISKDIIQFTFDVVAPATAVANDVINVNIYFLLDGDPTDRNTWTNYYLFTFSASNNDLPPGVTKVVLSATRGQFNRSGNNSLLDWTKVLAVAFSATTNSTLPTMVFGNVSMIGGVTGQVNGVFNYKQVNVNNNGIYLAKSPASPLCVNATDPNNTSPNFSVINGSVSLTPIKNDPQANEYWFFRIAANAPTIDPDTGLPVGSLLSNWNFVGKSTGGVFLDSLSDAAVIQQNIDGSILLNNFLLSLRLDDTGGGINDVLYGLEGLYNERVLYLSSKYIYLSDRLNPDAIDARFTLKPSGDATEINLWIKKLTNNVLILGTTKSLYEISGTLLNAPDQTIDANIISLGDSYPPISIDVCNWEGGLYYMAADGLRVTTGSNSVNISPALRHLFLTQYSGTLAGGGPAPALYSGPVRHGIASAAIYIGTAQRYGIVAAHNKIYLNIPLQDSRRIIVFDTVTKTYTIRDTNNPTGVFISQSGEVFIAYWNILHLVDYQAGYGWDGAGMPMLMRTVFDPNAQPRNRKDLFTLKLIADTGGASVGVSLQKDGIGVTEFDEPTYISLGNFSANGLTTTYIPLNLPALTLGMRYSLQLKDVAGLKIFKLYEYTIEYEARPEQLDYLRILPTNMGTISRKRWTAYAFVVDTLGNAITFTPYLDNVAWLLSGTVNNLTKLTFIFYFLSEAVATDMGGILSGGVFEFYGLNLEECVSEKLPVPVKFLVIPANNYGTPNRKRHTSYKYQILTRGKRVLFTPILDGKSYTTSIVNTTIKQTVEHFFSQSEGDVIGIDIGGTLTSLDDTPLEFYGVIVPQQVEQLPDRLEYLRTPNENFGVAAPKRIRTLPLIIDTYGLPVLFTPIVDGVAGSPTTLISSSKKTLYHYFSTDVFGTDYGGILQSSANPVAPFEFYGYGQPENVELLPVPKKFDQLGPMRFDKIGKIFGFRVRIIPNGATTSIPYAAYGDFDPLIPGGFVPLIAGNITVLPSYDNVYEVQFPKSVNTTIFRLFLGPTADSFHRYDVQIKVIASGMQSEARWLPIR